MLFSMEGHGPNMSKDLFQPIYELHCFSKSLVHGIALSRPYWCLKNSKQIPVDLNLRHNHVWRM